MIRRKGIIFEAKSRWRQAMLLRDDKVSQTFRSLTLVRNELDKLSKDPSLHNYSKSYEMSKKELQSLLESYEEKLTTWLTKKGLTFRTEEDLRNEYPKTPDVLLDKPINVRGSEVFWIESKGSFGDAIENRANTKRQLKPYVELFGPGMVIYWLGFLNNLPREDDILLEDATFLETWQE